MAASAMAIFPVQNLSQGSRRNKELLNFIFYFFFLAAAAQREIPYHVVQLSAVDEVTLEYTCRNASAVSAEPPNMGI